MHPNMSSYFYSRGIIKGWNASTNFDKVYEAVRVTDIYVQIELETCCGTNVNISKSLFFQQFAAACKADRRKTYFDANLLMI